MSKLKRDYNKEIIALKNQFDFAFKIAVDINADRLRLEQENTELKDKIKSVCVWVKASEFKTKEPLYSAFRYKRDDGDYDYGEIYITEDDGIIYLDINNERAFEPQQFERWNNYEILYEPSITKNKD